MQKENKRCTNLRILYRQRMALWMALCMLITVCTTSRAPGIAQAGTEAQATIPPAFWSLTCLDCPKYFVDTTAQSFRMDGTGVFHAVYGGEQLYHAWSSDGNAWAFEIVDASSNVGRHAALAIGPANSLHILYFADTSNALRYAYQENGTWHWEVVTEEGLSDAPHASLAVDAEGVPHVSYYRSATADLYYAVRQNDSWQHTAVDTQDDVGQYTSIALDQVGDPHIAYHRGTDAAPRYAYLDDSGWHIETVPGETGQYISLALDGDDRPHMAFFSDFYWEDTLQYIYWDGTDWQHESVTTVSVDGRDTTLILDENNQPHIAFVELAPNAPMPKPYIPNYFLNVLNHYSKVNGEWRGDGPSVFGQHPSLLLDGAGVLRMVSIEETEMSQFVQTEDGWQQSQIDAGGDVGRSTAMSVDLTGAIHLGYYDRSNHAMRYTRYDADGWHRETIVDAANEAHFPQEGKIALTVDGNGNAHCMIDIFTPSSSGLPANRYYFRDADGWHDSWHTEEELTALGTNFDIIADGQSKLHTIFDQSYAYRTGDEPWQTEDISTWSGTPMSIAAGANGIPQVAFQSHAGLGYAFKNDDTWLYGTVDDLGADGIFPAIALDSHSYPHIAYYDTTNGDLKYAAWNGASWQVQIVDSSGDVGQYASLAIDTGDRPYISYYDATAGNLKVATQTGEGWQILVLDQEGDVGQYTSIAIDRTGHPLIIYYDATNHDLKLAGMSVNSLYIPIIHNN